MYRCWRSFRTLASIHPMYTCSSQNTRHTSSFASGLYRFLKMKKAGLSAAALDFQWSSVNIVNIWPFRDNTTRLFKASSHQLLPCDFMSVFLATSASSRGLPVPKMASFLDVLARTFGGSLTERGSSLKRGRAAADSAGQNESRIKLKCDISTSKNFQKFVCKNSTYLEMVPGGLHLCHRYLAASYHHPGLHSPCLPCHSPCPRLHSHGLDRDPTHLGGHSHHHSHHGRHCGHHHHIHHSHHGLGPDHRHLYSLEEEFKARGKARVTVSGMKVHMGHLRSTPRRSRSYLPWLLYSPRPRPRPPARSPLRPSAMSTLRLRSSNSYGNTQEHMEDQQILGKKCTVHLWRHITDHGLDEEKGDCDKYSQRHQSSRLLLRTQHPQTRHMQILQ